MKNINHVSEKVRKAIYELVGNVQSTDLVSVMHEYHNGSIEVGLFDLNENLKAFVTVGHPEKGNFLS